MPPKVPYFIYFTASDRIRVRITTDRGRVLYYTLQYEALVEGVWYPVVRFDTAHGQAHIDYLDHHGRKVAKTDLGFFFPFDEALQWSLDDVEMNWMRYRMQFIRRRATT